MYRTCHAIIDSARSDLRTADFRWRFARWFVGAMASFVAATATHGQSPSVPASPVGAADTLACFELHPDCRIELVAAEPDVIDPVAIAFAPDGKLWVVEYSDYPNGPPENGPPLSRIRTLSDADGDGRYSNPVTFADKLLFANGLMLWQDGVIVTMDGAVTFMRDTDGDGRADEQTEWFRGFSRENPQLRANHPTLGLDGHIYIASGLRGGDVIAVREDWAKDAKPVSLSGRDFRFDPFTGKYEAVSGPGQFGLCFDPFGNRFVCSNRNPCNHIVLEERYLARNPFLAVSKVHEDVSPAAEKSRLYPISRTWTTSNLHANQFTAACGLLIYGGDALPQFRGNSFTCEPTANLVHRDVLEPEGATFTSHPGRDGVEFLATRDEWFRPVNLAHGPDGALYVVDMYRAVIEHPQFMPDELKTRPDLTLGNDRGRIYRIISKNPVNRAHDSSFRREPHSLVTHLQSPNAWHRETAFRLLLETDVKSLAADLHDVAQSASAPEARIAASAVLSAHHLMTRQDVLASIHDEHARIREQAVVLGETNFSDDADVRNAIIEILADQNTDSRLAFQATLSLGSFPPTDQSIPVLADVALRHAHDPWFRNAVGSSVGDAAHKLHLQVIRRSSHYKEQKPYDLIRELARLAAYSQDESAATAVLSVIATHPDNFNHSDFSVEWMRFQYVTLIGLADGLARNRTSLSAALDSLSDHQQEAIKIVFGTAGPVAISSEFSSAERAEAIRVLEVDPSADSIETLLTLIGRESDQNVLTAAIDAVSRKSSEQIADVLLDGFKARTPSVRSAILSAMLAQTDRTSRLLDEIAAGTLSSRDIDAATAGRLTRSRDAKINQRAAKLLVSDVDADRAKVIATYEPCLSKAGDPQRGFEVFRKTCAACHQVGNVGTNVGPDISDSRTKTPEFLLTNILDPNRAVDGNYFGYTILDAEGRVHTGIITAETASSVTLRIQEGKELTLLRTDIEDMANTGLSLMPVGVEKDITLEAMADLISYIKNWRYLDGAVPEEIIGR